MKISVFGFTLCGMEGGLRDQLFDFTLKYTYNYGGVGAPQAIF